MPAEKDIKSTGKKGGKTDKYRRYYTFSTWLLKLNSRYTGGYFFNLTTQNIYAINHQKEREREREEGRGGKIEEIEKQATKKCINK